MRWGNIFFGVVWVGYEESFVVKCMATMNDDLAGVGGFKVTEIETELWCACVVSAGFFEGSKMAETDGYVAGCADELGEQGVASLESDSRIDGVEFGIVLRIFDGGEGFGDEKRGVAFLGERMNDEGVAVVVDFSGREFALDLGEGKLFVARTGGRFEFLMGGVAHD